MICLPVKDIGLVVCSSWHVERWLPKNDIKGDTVLLFICGGDSLMIATVGKRHLKRYLSSNPTALLNPNSKTRTLTLGRVNGCTESKVPGTSDISSMQFSFSVFRCENCERIGSTLV
jgi:hypothetical protein